jgi:hypothetical protein
MTAGHFASIKGGDLLATHPKKEANYGRWRREEKEIKRKNIKKIF